MFAGGRQVHPGMESTRSDLTTERSTGSSGSRSSKKPGMPTEAWQVIRIAFLFKLAFLEVEKYCY